MRAAPSLVVGLLVTAILVGCEARGRYDLGRLPQPSPSAIDDAARSQLQRARNEVEELVRNGAPADRVGSAIGELGRLFHAYELFDGAETCYREAAALAPGDFRWPYLRGFLHQSRGELDDAAEAYAAATERRRDYLPLLVRSAEVELARQRPDAAADLLDRALRLDAESAAVHLGLGRLALDIDRPEEAVEHLERALAAEPEASEIHYPLGLAYRQIGDSENAQRYLESRGDNRVRLVDPPIAELQVLAEGGDARTRRGLDALARGEGEVAIDELRRAAAARPEDPEARRNLAIALARLGDLEAAEDAYRSLVELDPQDAAARLALGNLVARRGALAEAVGYFRGAVRLAPDFKQAHFTLAAALAELGRPTEALAAYDRVLDLDAAFADARTRRAVVLLELGREEEAKRELRDIVDTDPTQAQARSALAVLLARENDLDGAQRVLEEGLEATREPEAETRLRLELARLLLGRGAPDEALEQLRIARERTPGILDLTFETGRALLRLGRFRAAAEELAAVTAARPDFLPAWLTEAEAWLRAGDASLARQRLEAARRHHPDDADLTDALARLLATSPVPEVRDAEQAHALAEGLFARQRSPQHAETLAMSLAALGRFGEALEIQRALLDGARQSGAGPEWLERLEENLGRYERGEGARPLGGAASGS